MVGRDWFEINSSKRKSIFSWKQKLNCQLQFFGRLSNWTDPKKTIEVIEEL